ncbi:MAG: hypothetical protein WD627_00860 [Actinomycetota bacterium]
MDATIYLVRGGERRRVMELTSLRSDSIPFPEDMVRGGGTVRLLADFVGTTSDYWSMTFQVRPGVLVWWTLEERISQSSLWVH